MNHIAADHHTDQDYAEMERAQRLAYRAMVFGCEFTPEHGGADEAERGQIRLLEYALQIAKGIEPDQPDPRPARRKAPGALPIDWEPLAGVSLDRLILLARLRAVSDRHCLSQSPPPWKDICTVILKPLIELRAPDLTPEKLTDVVRDRAAALAEHLKPQRLKARYAEGQGAFAGWKKEQSFLEFVALSHGFD